MTTSTSEPSESRPTTSDDERGAWNDRLAYRLSQLARSRGEALWLCTCTHREDWKGACLRCGHRTTR